jgi:hypothetical protein
LAVRGSTKIKGTLFYSRASRINESYPDDQALGFAAGDLRGWFWVEIGEQQS